MTNDLRRRRFIQILPAAGLIGGTGLLSACSEKPAEPAAAPPAAPAPAAAASAAPEAPAASAASAATPASEPASAAQPATTPAPAATGSLPMLDPKAPNAQGLAYVADARQVDATRFPNFKPGQNCANCALFQAPAGAQAGPCPLFAGYQVAAAGWCSAWARRG